MRKIADRTKKVVWLSKIFTGAEKGLDKLGLRSISFKYDARSDLKNNRVGTDYLDAAGGGNSTVDDFLSYTVGKEGRSLLDMMTGEMDERNAYGGMYHRARLGEPFERYKDDVHGVTQSWSLDAPMNIPDPINLSISPLLLKWERRFSTKPDTLWVDTTTTWPHFSVRASSSVLSKLGVVKKLMSQFSVSSQYTLTREISRKGYATVSNGSISLPKLDTTVTHSWKPLIRADATLKGKLPLKLRYEHSYHTKQRQARSWTRTQKHTDNIGVDYELQRSGKERAIKIFKWKIPITGRLTMGVSLDRSHDESFVDRSLDSAGVGGEPDVENEPTTDRVEWSILPSVRYEFTKSVDGKLEYKYTLSDDRVAVQKVYNHLMTISVTIRF
jgi:hypothetical protein